MGRTQAGYSEAAPLIKRLPPQHPNPKGVAERSVALSGLMFGVVFITGVITPACGLIRLSALVFGVCIIAMSVNTHGVGA